MTDYPTYITDYPTYISEYPTYIADYPTYIADYPTYITDYPTYIADYPTYIADYPTSIVFVCKTHTHPLEPQTRHSDGNPAALRTKTHAAKSVTPNANPKSATDYSHDQSTQSPEKLTHHAAVVLQTCLPVPPGPPLGHVFGHHKQCAA